MDFDVFLCHNSSDKSAVLEIGERLRREGIRPWLDVWELRPGVPWQDVLEEQIATIRTAAIVLGPSGRGPWQNQEMRAFLREFAKRECPVIPVILAECRKPPGLPIFLEAFTWVDFRNSEPEPFDQLVWGITGKKPGAAYSVVAEKRAMPPNNLPFASLGDLFAGRQDLLAALEKNLDPSAPTALVQAQAVSGLGGVGKTRLAIEFAYRKASHFSAIFFVGADGEAELRRNFAALAGRSLLNLGLPAETPENVVLEAVRVALRERQHWLLILDNVDSVEAQLALRSIFPLQGGQVLITSRLQNWQANIRQLQVDRLEPPAAREYLLKATNQDHHRADVDTAADHLAEKLGYLPLALELTAAYVRENGLSISDLLVDWPEEEQGILAWHDPAITEYPTSLALAWSRSVEKLTAGAQAVLCVLSHFAPEPIALAMLEEGAEILSEATGGELDLRDALADLQRYSLLSRELEGEKKTITLHRLVQAVARNRITVDQKRVWAERAARLVSNFAPRPPDDVRTWTIWDPLRPHVARVVELAEAYGVAQPTSVLLNELAGLLWAKALYVEAEPLMRRSLVISEASYGKGHPKVATVLNNLAQLLRDTNRHIEAEPLMRRSLTILENSFGTNDPRVAGNIDNLATLLKATSRFEEAEPLMLRSLEIYEATYGKDHPKVAIVLNNLAQLLQATNRLAEAEPLMRRALEIDDLRAGKDHPKVAIRLNNLASLLRETNRFAEAEVLMRRALSIDENSFGGDHPKVAIRLNNLAQLLLDTKRLTEAEPLIRRALEIDESTFGKNHPNVAVDLSSLAQLLQVTQRFAEAEPLMRRALAISEASFGEDHPNVAAYLNNLAVLLHASHRFLEAEPLMRRSLEINEACFGENHSNVATHLNNLGRLLQATNRFAEAKPLLLRSVAIFEDSLGVEHPSTATARTNLEHLLGEIAATSDLNE